MTKGGIFGHADGLFIPEYLKLKQNVQAAFRYGNFEPRAAMIRVLVVDRLSPKVLDLLNEIPEFEVSEKTGLSPAQLLDEIKNADALIISGSLPLTEEILNGCGDLKLIIRSNDVSGPVDTATAKRKNIEIRTAVGHSSAQPGDKTKETVGIDAIAILKDFFNV